MSRPAHGRRRALRVVAAGLFAVSTLASPALIPPASAAEAPRRVVSLGGPVSEVVAALGAAGSVVGVDTTTRFPAAYDALPRVGYLRALSAEGLLSLTPDRVIAQADAGPSAVLDQVAAAGVAVEVLPEVTDPAALLATVERVAEVLGRAEAGHALAASLRADLAALAAETATYPDRPGAMFLLVGHGAPNAAGRQTAMDGLMALAGLRNVFDAEGWKPVAPEALAAADPDIILVADMALDRLGGLSALQALPVVAGSRAIAEGRVLALDATVIQGFGPRTPAAARALAADARAMVAGTSPDPHSGALPQ